MLYYLFRLLEQYNIPGSHLWSYISFRALLTLILSLLLSAWFGEKFIKWMKRKKIFETERDPSIDPFGVEKKGVPCILSGNYADAVGPGLVYEMEDTNVFA